MSTKAKVLLQTLQMEIANVNDFTIKKGRLGNRLIIASFICTGFISILTGGEVGGLWSQVEVLSQAVMILAAVCAFAATVMTGIYKQLVIPSQLADAQTGKTDLENLELEVRGVRNDADLAEATKRFEQIRKSVSFIPDDPSIELIALRQVTGKIKEAVAVPLSPDIFDCSGEVENMSNGLHLWLAVTNKGGRGWPKDSEFGYSPRGGSPCDGSWEHQFYSKGDRRSHGFLQTFRRWASTGRYRRSDSEKFEVSLLVTNGQANQEIYKWINRCNSKSRYPAFRWPRKGGIKVLDRRTILRHKQGYPTSGSALSPSFVCPFDPLRTGRVESTAGAVAVG